MDNTSLFFFIFDLSHQFPLLGKFMIFGSKFMIQITFILMLILFIKGKTEERKSFLIALISLPIMFLIIGLIHIFIVEQRPFIQYELMPLINPPSGLSFPSKHSSIIATLAFSYIWYKSKWSPVFLFIMAWVGISRVFVGVHFPLDVLGGFVVGALSVFITHEIKKVLKRRLMFK